MFRAENAQYCLYLCRTHVLGEKIHGISVGCFFAVCGVRVKSRGLTKKKKNLAVFPFSVFLGGWEVGGWVCVNLHEAELSQTPRFTRFMEPTLRVP